MLFNDEEIGRILAHLPQEQAGDVPFETHRRYFDRALLYYSEASILNECAPQREKVVAFYQSVYQHASDTRKYLQLYLEKPWAFGPAGDVLFPSAAAPVKEDYPTVDATKDNGAFGPHFEYNLSALAHDMRELRAIEHQMESLVEWARLSLEAVRREPARNQTSGARTKPWKAGPRVLVAELAKWYEHVTGGHKPPKTTSSAFALIVQEFLTQVDPSAKLPGSTIRAFLQEQEKDLEQTR